MAFELVTALAMADWPQVQKVEMAASLPVLAAKSERAALSRAPAAQRAQHRLSRFGLAPELD